MKVKTKISTRCDLETYICKAIDTAKTSIDIICFEVSSERIIENIKKKGCEGIHVTIHCEKRKATAGLLSLGTNNDNISIQLSEPNEYYYALHEKFLLIDKKRLIFGTFNLSDKSLRKNIEILFDTKNLTFVEEFSNHLDHLSKGKSKKFISSDKSNQIDKDCFNHSRLVFSNECNMFDIISKYIKSAKSSITVYASHRISNDVSLLLTNAIEHDIEVNIVKDFSTLSGSYLKNKLKNYTRYVHIDGKMHIKAILIDEDTFLIGSLNLFERSLFKDQEYLFIGNDKIINSNIRLALNDVRHISKPHGVKVYTKLFEKKFIDRLFGSIKKARRYLINKYYK